MAEANPDATARLDGAADVNADNLLDITQTALPDTQTNQLTYDHLIADEKFIRLMRTALARLEKTYGVPVQFEFALEIIDTPSGPDYKLYILQCHTAV